MAPNASMLTKLFNNYSGMEEATNHWVCPNLILTNSEANIGCTPAHSVHLLPKLTCVKNCDKLN